MTGLPDPLPASYLSAAWFDSDCRIPRDLLDQIKPDSTAKPWSSLPTSSMRDATPTAWPRPTT